ncbi:hypothetical protein NPX13_g3651 [Xylaria arbuscula]|uniref:EKC/KEOPS complex subunit BUD32 n=1 Tax=Xylaria arbuscula TaxID=114810 RepID=A0A9W8NGW9_9PEZI|nr:hypothetical protein NPX13_g3651 [Xylaria arbuscula]
MSRIYSKLLGNWTGTQSQQNRKTLTYNDINEQLSQLCIPATGSHWPGGRISENGVRKIQTWLRELDRQYTRHDDVQWASRPRLYAILHNIRAVEYMDNFIEEHLTDFSLPFNEQTLPHFISDKNGMNLRRAFFTIQEHFLTLIKDIESEKSEHLRLSVSGDTFFISHKPLGFGSFGAVDLVTSRLSTESYARKRTLRSRGSEQAQMCLVEELRALRRLSHQHLVRIIGSYTDTQYIAYLMKPVASRTLQDFLSSPQSLRVDEKNILRPFYGCLSGAMNYLYAHRVRHRDLTARNILIDHHNKVYISDFGSSYSWEAKPSSKTKHRNVPTSPDYMAPEVAKEEERGTQSDMWSLGIIFLEMTTKLLDHRLATFRSKLKQNADKEKVKPYAYANMPAVINWMKTLGTTNTEYEYDKEPLGWIRQLLHLEYEHRLTPPQLVRYVSESPSLHSFSCIECRDDFQNEGFTYGLVGPRTDAREESERTRQEIESVFIDSTPETVPNEGTSSIEQWIQGSYPFATPATDLPATPHSESSTVFEDAQGSTSIGADQFLYNLYEHEIYSPPYSMDFQGSRFGNDGPFPSLDPVESYELPESKDWIEETEIGSDASSKLKRKEKNLKDSNLGFLEYISNSTDDNDESGLPFEEWSDRSSLQSDGGSPILTPTTPISGLFSDAETFIEQEKQSKQLNKSFELQFEEEQDVSDTDSQDGEVSAQVGLNDQLTTEKRDDWQLNEPATGDAKHTIIRPVHISKAPTSSLSTLDRAPTLENTAGDLERNGVATTLPQDAEILSSTFGDQTGKAGIIIDIPLSEVLSPPLDLSSTAPSKSKAETEVRKGARKKTSSQPKTKSQKHVRIHEAAQHIKGEKGKDRDQAHDPGIPTIVVDAAPDDPRPDEAPLSKENLKYINKTARPIVPKKRDALVPVDLQKLIDSTWERASSAPTSVMSTGTKSKIINFFLMMPGEKEIENLLSYHCQKGSASAVRAILQKLSLNTKTHSKRRYFYPLVYAVRGGSSRHNKCVRALLEEGANPNLKTRKSGVTPLHIAVQHSKFKGYTNLILLLLSHDADPNIADPNDEYPLTKVFAGADTGPLEPHKRGALIMLLKEGASPNLTISGTGNTLLHQAVRRQDKISVAMLLHKGAKVDAKNMGGATPF